MKKLLSLFLISLSGLAIAQSDFTKNSFELSTFYGNTFEHNSEIGHLLNYGHPSGFALHWNSLAHPEKYWSQKNNFPEIGLSLFYQDANRKELGENTSLSGHISWFFLNRHLQFKVSQGITYNNNPFHIDKNFRNNAYGSKLMATTRAELNLISPAILENFNLFGGLGLVHYSNGAARKPNIGTNTLYIQLGMRYAMDKVNLESIEYQNQLFEKQAFAYEIFLRTGMSQHDIREPIRAFFVPGLKVSKRFSYRSGLHLGTEFFYSPVIKDYIKFTSVAYPEEGFSGDEKSHRLGVFAGYDMYVSDNFMFFADFGYYVYWPVKYETREYHRLGMKYYIKQQDIALMFNVKAHYSKAEAIELGLTYRFL